MKPAARAGAAGDRAKARDSNATIAELEGLFTPPAQWIVTVTKASRGAVVVFATATCKTEADSTCARLRSFGLNTSVKLIRETVSAGTTIEREAQP